MKAKKIYININTNKYKQNKTTQMKINIFENMKIKAN